MRALPLPDCVPAGIALHGLALDLHADPRGAWPDLTLAECARAARYRQVADRARFAQARAASRRLLAARIGCRPADVPLVLDAHGKPHVDLPGAPLFNVSHAGGQALIALAEADVVAQLGVDIEWHDADADVDAVLELAFTDAERDAVRFAADRRQAIYARWVGKEAVLKAVGVGIGEHLRDVTIHPCGDGRLDIACTQPAWQGIEAIAPAAPRGYTAALAWRLKEPT